MKINHLYTSTSPLTLQMEHEKCSEIMFHSNSRILLDMTVKLIDRPDLTQLLTTPADYNGWLWLTRFSTMAPLFRVWMEIEMENSEVLNDKTE